MAAVVGELMAECLGGPNRQRFLNQFWLMPSLEVPPAPQVLENIFIQSLAFGAPPSESGEKVENAETGAAAAVV